MKIDISPGLALKLLSMKENAMLLLIFVINLGLLAFHFLSDVDLYFLTTLVNEIRHVMMACEKVEQVTIDYVLKEYVFMMATVFIFDEPMCLEAAGTGLLVSSQILNCFLNELVSLLHWDPQFLSLWQPIIENNDCDLVY